MSDPNIQAAYNLGISICNSTNPIWRYSTNGNLRLGLKKYNGYMWCDCSGFIWHILHFNGFKVGSTMATSTEVTTLTKAGFTEVPITGAWKAGDIVWRSGSPYGHTEMVYKGGNGGGFLMGSHNAKRDIPDQVSINNFRSYASEYMKLFRYGDVTPGEHLTWYVGSEHEYLSEEHMQNNARIVYQFFSSKGWSTECIAALLGNMELESTINPACIEVGGTGHGLVQWTPPEALYNVLDAVYGTHTDWTDGNKQLNCIYAEYQQSSGEKQWGIEGQWIATSEYPESWKEWTETDKSVDYLTLAFLWNYERPAKAYAKEKERKEAAEKWYKFITNIPPGSTDPGGEGSIIKKMPLFMYRKHIY